MEGRKGERARRMRRRISLSAESSTQTSQVKGTQQKDDVGLVVSSWSHGRGEWRLYHVLSVGAQVVVS